MSGLHEQWAIWPDLNKRERERVANAERLDHACGDDGIEVEREMDQASLNAVAREAKRRGWIKLHQSESNGRASSRYFVVMAEQGEPANNYGELGRIRVSDHDIDFVSQAGEDVNLVLGMDVDPRTMTANAICDAARTMLLDSLQD